MKFPLQGTPLDIVKGSVITLALFLAYTSLPLIGLLPGMLAPVAGMWYYLKTGKFAGFSIVVITAVVASLVDGPSSAAVYLMQCGVLTLALPLFLTQGKGGARSIVYSVAISLAVILAVAAAYGFATGINLHLQIVKGINSSIAQTVAVYEKTGIKGDELKHLQQAMLQAAETIARVYPALITVGLSIIAGLNLLLLKRLTRRNPLPIILGDFSQFRNPEQLVWVLIAAGFAMLIDNGIVKSVSLNLLIVLSAVYFFQGMAVITYLFTRHAVPLFVRFIFYLLLSFQPFIALAVAALGVFDLWGNFRTPKNKGNL